jgi:acetyl esterase
MTFTTIIGDVGTLDADAQKVLELAAAAGRPPLHVLGAIEARKSLPAARAFLGEPAPAANIRDLVADLPGGATKMRLYRPKAAPKGEALPLAVYFHGGGWVLGDLDFGQWFCASLVDRLNIAVLNVDYRLAPEHPFPAAVEDAIQALDWASGAARELDAMPDRMAVIGDSAGGNLAAVAALHARDSGFAGLLAQVLIYPVIDLAMQTESYRRNGEGYMLTAETMAWFKGEYLRGASDSDWRASPARALLHDLAPALILTGGFDPLADEARDYASALNQAGVSVKHLHFAGQLHGFLMWAKIVQQSKTALNAISDYLGSRLIA